MNICIFLPSSVLGHGEGAFSYSLENDLRTLLFTTNSYNKLTRPLAQVAISAKLNLLTLTSLVSLRLRNISFIYMSSLSNCPWIHFYRTTKLFIVVITCNINMFCNLLNITELMFLFINSCRANV